MKKRKVRRKRGLERVKRTGKGEEGWKREEKVGQEKVRKCGTRRKAVKSWKSESRETSEKDEKKM